jgi:hypothetical protein
LEFTLATGGLRPPNLRVHLVIFYTLVVLLGILSMGFQLLASRLLNPFFWLVAHCLGVAHFNVFGGV